MSFREDIKFFQLLNHYHLKKIGKYLVIMLLIGLFLIFIGHYIPTIDIIGNIGMVLVWIVISLVIFHFQFIYHEYSHFVVGNKSEEINWLIYFQGPYGVQILKTIEESNDQELKELKAPYIGLGFLVNVLLIALQIFGTYEIFTLLTYKWLIFPLIFLWIIYLFNILDTLLIVYWTIFKPKKTRLATITSILTGTDIIMIALLNSITLPDKVMKSFNNFNREDYFIKIQKKIADGEFTTLYKDKKFTVFQ